MPWPTPPAPTSADRESFQAWHSREKLFGLDTPEAELRQRFKSTADGHVGQPSTNPSIPRAIIAGEEKYADIRLPILAIFAIPADLGPFANGGDPAARAAFDSGYNNWKEVRAKAFEAGVPSALVVRLSHANHYVFMSNEADVLREMRAFLAGLN